MATTTRIRIFYWTLWALLPLLAACAKTIPPEELKGVDQSISFQALSRNPETFLGKTVVLGGDIISTENQPEKTTLMVLQRALDGDLKPSANDQSQGRFIATVPEFLDPAIYAKGRRITIVGRITGKEIRQLSEIPYTYPVIEENTHYLWPIENIPDSEPRVVFGIGIGFGGYGF